VDDSIGLVLAVIEIADFRAEARRIFGEQGVPESRRTWRLDYGEVTWLFKLDRKPYGVRLALDIGLNLTEANELSSSAAPTDCSVGLSADHLPLAFATSEFDRARLFDLESSLGDTERLTVLEDVIRTIVLFAKSVPNLEAAKAQYLAGTFAWSIILKDSRELLEGANSV
jgi:hypothetical protein